MKLVQAGVTQRKSACFPRKNGNSITLAQRVAKGAEAAGAEVESFYLHEMDIKPCDACDICLEDSSKDCIIDDDMQNLYPKLRQADALVIASPIYCATVAAETFAKAVEEHKPNILGISALLTTTMPKRRGVSPLLPLRPLYRRRQAS